MGIIISFLQQHPDPSNIIANIHLPLTYQIKADVFSLIPILQQTNTHQYEQTNRLTALSTNTNPNIPKRLQPLIHLLANPYAIVRSQT